ncbi:hypothetical protein TEA_022350 [Camellia sinensis var. sinensis]|uniref:AP2/ERF domain-containing protein n=1 Tax=Camellia sinensis var. sinensis TaxID=542762 RepID=A0A4S4EQ69_CAMSN|nr:hypothetical protein TEA_022350 [Camellia sinensis var. sinensis]
MVSIRRRKLLGLCSGRSSFFSPLPRFSDNGNASGNPTQNAKPVSVHPMPSVDGEQPKEGLILAFPPPIVLQVFCLKQVSIWISLGLVVTSVIVMIWIGSVIYKNDSLLSDHFIVEVLLQMECINSWDVGCALWASFIHQNSSMPDYLVGERSREINDRVEIKTISKVSPGSSNASGSSSSKEQHNQQYPVPEVKRRKRHRRKHFENQEPCLMRGVYFKNMKWQAAIKVDKKQIHLGTVGSQEAAARLYDRAAFMCGREPNFELSEEEKQELRKFKWDEFLAMTRSAITNKRHRRRTGAGARRKSEPSTQNSDWEGEQGVNGFSASEDVEPETSLS